MCALEEEETVFTFFSRPRSSSNGFRSCCCRAVVIIDVTVPLLANRTDIVLVITVPRAAGSPRFVIPRSLMTLSMTVYQALDP